MSQRMKSKAIPDKILWLWVLNQGGIYGVMRFLYYYKHCWCLVLCILIATYGTYSNYSGHVSIFDTPYFPIDLLLFQRLVGWWMPSERRPRWMMQLTNRTDTFSANEKHPRDVSKHNGLGQNDVDLKNNVGRLYGKCYSRFHPLGGLRCFQ